MSKEKETITITHIEKITLEGENNFVYVPAGRAEPVKKKKQLSPRVFLLAGMMLLALATGALIYTLTSKNATAVGELPEASLPESAEQSAAERTSPAAESEAPSVGSAPESAVSEASSEAESEASAEAPESAEPSAEEQADLLAPPADYDYAAPVPETAEQTADWFNDAVFVGNSRTQGLLLYGSITAKSYADVGLTVETAFSDAKFTDASGAEVTADAALRTGDYRKAYLMFGINELGWERTDVFLSKYGALIDGIRESHPDAQVYIQSILPVSAGKVEETSYLSNERIVAFNRQLQQLAEEKSVFYLDVASIFQDESGALPEELSNDGVHLKKDGCLAWKDYLLRHCVTALEFSEPADGVSDGSSGYAAISLPSVSN